VIGDYSTLARAISGFTDRLEEESRQANAEKHRAATVLRQLFPDISEEQSRIRLRQFDVRAEERARTVLRLRRLLAMIADGTVTLDNLDETLGQI
jgi:hypothetical protein